MREANQEQRQQPAAIYGNNADATGTGAYQLDREAQAEEEGEKRIRLCIHQGRQHPVKDAVGLAVGVLRGAAQTPERVGDEHAEEREAAQDVKRGDALARLNGLERERRVVDGQSIFKHLVPASEKQHHGEVKRSSRLSPSSSLLLCARQRPRHRALHGDAEKNLAWMIQQSASS